MNSSCARRWALLLGILLPVSPATALAQRGVEAGFQGIGTFADFDLVGGGLWGALRPGGRTRIGISLMPGVSDERFLGRAELVTHFLLNPASQRGGPYAGGGLAGTVGRRDQGYLMVVLGYEIRPGGTSGWVIETGIGGGVRVLLGYRWRRLRR